MDYDLSYFDNLSEENEFFGLPYDEKNDSLIKQYIQTKIDQEVKKVQHDNEILVNTILDTPIGVSKWKKIGEKFGYYEYFRKEEVKKIVEEIKEEVLSAKYGTKNRVELLCKLNSYIK